MNTKKANAKVILRPIVILFISLLFFCVSVMFGKNVWVCIVFTIWVNIVNFLSLNAKKNMIFICFLIAFFVFLVSGQIVQEFFGYSMAYQHGEAYYTHMNVCLMISLIGLIIGYAVSASLRRRASPTTLIEPLFEEKQELRIMRKTAKGMFFITSIPWFAVLLEMAIYVQATTYYDLYTTYSSHFPGIVTVVADACPYFFYFYCATMPNKKDCTLPFFIFVLYGALSLFTGRRLSMVTMYIFVIIYLNIRNHYASYGSVWFGKRERLFTICAIPLVLAFLFSFRYIRTDKGIEADSLLDMICGFFQQQGFSANVIVLAKNYEDVLPPDQYYSFYGIIRFLRVNPFTTYVLRLDYSSFYSGDRSSMALYGHSLARNLSYVVSRNGYLAGHGLGSCYVAELYHDFGYFGVFGGNVLYGFGIQALFKIKKSVIGRAVSFILLEKMLSTPRYNYDSVIAQLTSSTMWVAILSVVIITQYASKRSPRSLKKTTKDRYELCIK